MIMIQASHDHLNHSLIKEPIMGDIIRSSETYQTFNTDNISSFLSQKDASEGKNLAAFCIKHTARRSLPYGIWTCVDGRKIVFNREYQPILQQVDGVNSYAIESEWVENIEHTQYLYDDVTTPISYLMKYLGQEKLTTEETKWCKKTLLICLQVLRDFTPKEGSSVNSRYSLAK